MPTVNWGLENTFDFCFNGIEKGSTVAVSTYMSSAHGNRSDQKEFFVTGYNEMLKRIEPETIICYHYPFPEMVGNILFVDYDLSSWQHYDDDKIELPYTQSEKYLLGIEKPTKSNIVVKFCDGVCNKGSGSVHGGQWRPHPDKPQDQRFIGKPGETKHTFIPTKKGGYWSDTKIGKDGRATTDRHHSDHGNSNKHSNPHDHKISWDDNTGAPTPSKPINYLDGNIPELKYFKTTGERYMNTEFSGDFKTKYEFKDVISRNCELVFEWKGIEYYIFPAENDSWVFGFGDNEENDVYYANIDDLMNHKIGDDKLIDICTKITVIERSL